MLNSIKNTILGNSEKHEFYKNCVVEKVEWWLMDCCYYPELFWARLRIFSNGTVDVMFQDENKAYGFENKYEAEFFLVDDEFRTFHDMDDEDKEFIKIPLNTSIETPNWENNEAKDFEYIGKYC